jgi:hypothetical protein
MKKMKKEGPRGENTFEKKKLGLYRVLSGHPSFELTQRVEQFFPGQLQAHVLNETDSVKAPVHSSPRLTCRVRSGLITMVFTFRLHMGKRRIWC